MNLLQDLPAGPLDVYRKKSSFDWKTMKLLIFGEHQLKVEYETVAYMRTESLFDKSQYEHASVDELRRRNVLQAKKLSPRITTTISYPEYAISCFDPTVGVRWGVNKGLFQNTIKVSGTKKHEWFIKAVDDMEINGAFCLTEVGHGSNARAMKTEARYDNNTKEFIFNTPDFEAAKCWAGSLGKVATHAVVFAQLFTADGKCHGLHSFIIQIRDMKTHLPLPGLTLGDLGHKIGLNGMDNGFMIMRNHRVSKDALLNKFADIDDNGNYVSSYKTKGESSGATFASLSNGRMNVAIGATSLLFKALTIAIRYAGVRKQFGPGEDEIPILEYQTHQFRLLPYLAGNVALRISNLILAIEFFNRQEKKTLTLDYGKELHGISCVSKAYNSWFAASGIQECREACGAHGFLTASEFGDLKAANEAYITYEGENNLIIQQTGRWLLKYLPMIMEGKPIDTPLQSLNFLTHFNEILASKNSVNFDPKLLRLDDLLSLYDWLVCFLLQRTGNKFQKWYGELNNLFEANNFTQTFNLKTASIAFYERFIIQNCIKYLQTVQDVSCKLVLEKLFKLYALYALEKHSAYFYEGGYFTSNDTNLHLQEALLYYMNEIKDEAVSLADAVAPHDYLIGSPLGKADGQVYKHLEAITAGKKQHLERVDWYQSIQKSKL